MFSVESASQPWSTPDLALWLVLIKESECGGRDVAGLDCVWTVVRRTRQYWKVTMAAPSYTNICPQSAVRPVNRSEYQNINLSPSYGREREREGELARLYSQFMPAANIMREQPEKLGLSSLIIVFY